MEHFTIQTLGTGAADFDWSRIGEEGVRGSSSTLLNGSVLIDAGISAWENLERFAISPSQLTDLVFTHTHSDHFFPPAIAKIVTARCDVPPLRIWVSPEGAEILSKELQALPNELHPIKWGDVFECGELRFTTLPSNHLVENIWEQTFWYLVETPHGNLLYALDGAWMRCQAAYLIGKKKLSWIVWDATMENAGDWRSFEHSDLTMLEMEIRAMRVRGTVDDSTLHIISHLARTLWPDQETSRQHAEARGFLMAYDGMKLEL